MGGAPKSITLIFFNAALGLQTSLTQHYIKPNRPYYLISGFARYLMNLQSVFSETIQTML